MKINFRKITPKTMPSILDFGILRPYLTIPFRPRGAKALYSYLASVVKDFFWLQFSVAHGKKDIPIISVDHPLDAKVPFTPKKVDVYLDFINFWIRPMTLLVCRSGEKKALPLCYEFFSHIKRSYKEASRIYKFRMTTTNRPECPDIKEFKTIHRLDPHLLCVPSLHVSICVLATSFYSKAFKTLNFTEKEQTFYGMQIYLGALSITETVLYVKQHSVNCIPAALYMMTHIIPEYFSIDDATLFIEDLFTGKTDTEKSPYANIALETDKKGKYIPLLSKEDAKKIREHIHLMFEKLVLEGCNEEDWAIPVQRWILNYNSSGK